MRIWLKVCFLLIVLINYGCRADKAVESVSEEHSISFVILGPEYPEFNKTPLKGFGVQYYCYINLNTDSVFIRRKDDKEDPKLIQIKTGYFPGISEQEYIENATRILKNQPEGLDPYNSKDICYRSTFLPIYVNYKWSGKSKDFFYCKTYQNTPISFLKTYLTDLIYNEQLKELKSKTFDEDSTLKPILSANGIDSLYPPVPYKVVKTIKFMPPVNGYEKDSAKCR